MLDHTIAMALMINRHKKEPPGNPQSPKALDFRPFCHSDNSISLYQFLGLHFNIISGIAKSIFFCESL